jgi:hypothetical protein
VIQGSLERLVEKLRQVAAVGIEGLNQAEDRCTKTVDQFRERFLPLARLLSVNARRAKFGAQLSDVRAASVAHSGYRSYLGAMRAVLTVFWPPPP